MDKETIEKLLSSNVGELLSIYWDRGNGGVSRVVRCIIEKGRQFPSLYQVEGGRELDLSKIGYSNIFSIEFE